MVHITVTLVLTVFLKLLFRQYILWCDGDTSCPIQVSGIYSSHGTYDIWLVTLYAFLLWGLSSYVNVYISKSHRTASIQHSLYSRRVVLIVDCCFFIVNGIREKFYTRWSNALPSIICAIQSLCWSYV